MIWIVKYTPAVTLVSVNASEWFEMDIAVHVAVRKYMTNTRMTNIFPYNQSNKFAWQCYIFLHGDLQNVQ